MHGVDDEATEAEEVTSGTVEVQREDDMSRSGEDIETVPEETTEAIRPRVVSTPPIPSRQEVLEHNVTHCPFRAWCPWCVQGKSKATPHYSSGGSSEQGHVPVVAFDYCFMSDRGKASEG